MQKSDKKKPLLYLSMISYTTFICFAIIGLLWAPYILAEGSTVLPSFNTNSLKVSKNSVLEANINLKTAASTKVSGASIYLKYPAAILQYQDAEPNDGCKSNNFKLNQLLEAKADAKAGLLKISRVGIAPDNQLPSGEFCLTTVRFKATSSFWFWLPWYSRSGEISFSDTNKWQIVGPQGVSNISNEALQTKIQVTETN